MATHRRITRQMAALDESLGRIHRVPDPSEDPSSPASVWARVLKRHGVPAVVRDGSVYVPRIGRVEDPGRGVNLDKAAKRFLKQHGHSLPKRDTGAARLAPRGERALFEAAQVHLPGRALKLQAEDGSVTVLDTYDQVIGAISQTYARARGGDRIEGDFFVGGTHWAALRAALSTLDPIAAAGLHRRFPDGTDDSWLEDAEAASRRMWLDRTLVFAHTLRVDIGDASLTFEPLTGTPLEVPFAFEREERRFTGALRITALEAPLPCRWDQRTDAETLALAWSLALIAYARLTCVPVRTATPRLSAPASSRGRSRTAGPQPRSVERAAPSGLPSGFTAYGDTARLLASYVAGHRRRLQPHQSHSSEAAANAAAVGIRLRPNETWVQPHVRGLSLDAVLHFAWHGPTWLRT